MAFNNFEKYKENKGGNKLDSNFITASIATILLISLFVFLINYASNLYNSDSLQSKNSSSTSQASFYSTSALTLVSANTDKNKNNFNITSLTVQSVNDSYLSFNGINNYVRTINPLNINSSVNKSVSAWFYAKNDSQNNRNTIFVGGAYSNSNLSNEFYMRRETGASTWSITFMSTNITAGSNTNTSCTYYVNSTVFPKNEWINVVAVYNKTSLYVYKNGALIGSTQMCIAWENGLMTNARMGGSSSTESFNGSIDEIRLYNRTLSSTEITQIYNSGRLANSSLPSDGLVAWFPFDEYGGTTAYNLANTSNNGVIYGT
jgi:hypothetical protein